MTICDMCQKTKPGITLDIKYPPVGILRATPYRIFDLCETCTNTVIKFIKGSSTR